MKWQPLRCTGTIVVCPIWHHCCADVIWGNQYHTMLCFRGLYLVGLRPRHRYYYHITNVVRPLLDSSSFVLIRVVLNHVFLRLMPTNWSDCHRLPQRNGRRTASVTIRYDDGYYSYYHPSRHYTTTKNSIVEPRTIRKRAPKATRNERRLRRYRWMDERVRH